MPLINRYSGSAGGGVLGAGAGWASLKSGKIKKIDRVRQEDLFPLV